MLEIKLLSQEFWDPVKEEFINMPAMTLRMEHSLVSVSKWERKWKKPYLTTDKKTDDEFFDYLRCMTITPKDVPILVYRSLPQSILDQIVNGTFRNLLNTDLKLKNKILKSMSELKEPLISYFLYKYDGSANSIIISLKPEFRINPLLLINNKSKKEVSKMGFDKSVHTFISVYNKKK